MTRAEVHVHFTSLPPGMCKSSPFHRRGPLMDGLEQTTTTEMQIDKDHHGQSLELLLRDSAYSLLQRHVATAVAVVNHTDAAREHADVGVGCSYGEEPEGRPGQCRQSSGATLDHYLGLHTQGSVYSSISVTSPCQLSEHAVMRVGHGCVRVPPALASEVGPPAKDRIFALVLVPPEPGHFG